MDVTKHNFQSTLDGLDKELQQASFLAIDTEFTGLTQRKTKFSALDTPAERYAKVYNDSLQFLVIQFGLSIFKYDKQNKKYVNKTYNFYVFPNTCPGLCDTTFLCQASSLEFLVSQGFDFNKLIKEGIPYLNLVDEERVKRILEKRNNKCDSGTLVPNKVTDISPNQQDFMKNTISKVTDFLSNKDGGEDKKELTLKCDKIQQELIFSHVQHRFSGASFESSDQSCVDSDSLSNRTVTVKRADSSISKKESNKKEFRPASSAENQLKNIEEYVGFSQVIKKIKCSGKLVVGHNSLLDLCHILHQFCGPLPEDYEEFKDMANTFFPRFVDTKVMAVDKSLQDLLPNSALEPLLKNLRKDPFKKIEIVPAPNFPSYNLDVWKNHEAGYDAFITGVCFITMASYLEETSSHHPKAIGHESIFVTPFYQKIFMMMSNDIPYMALSGPDLEPSRDHVFKVTFPQNWKLQDIFQLFKVHGSVRVDWTGDTSAFVTLHRKENSHFVLRETILPLGCTIMSYESHLKSMRLGRSKIYDAATRKRSLSSTPGADVSLPISKKVCQNPLKNEKIGKAEFEVPDDWA